MAAEQEIFGVITTGAEQDFEAVTRIGRSMVGRWGMSSRVGKLSVLLAAAGIERPTAPEQPAPVLPGPAV